MGDFQHTQTFASRKERHCPECGETISVGQRYAKETGSWEGDFYTAFMCLPCKVFTDRYVESMQLNASLNWDEVAYSFGDIIKEAAEYAEYKRPPRQPRPEVRAAVMALFGEIDIAERTYQRRERENARRARASAHRHSLNLAASRRMVRGMSACSAHHASAA